MECVSFLLIILLIKRYKNKDKMFPYERKSSSNYKLLSILEILNKLDSKKMNICKRKVYFKT